jgi:Alpha-L-arabinofuranosidase B (ABFB) domain
MEDPDAARPQSRGEGLYDLVRPYVADPVHEDGEGRPGDDYSLGPPPPANAGFGGLPARPGPGERSNWPGWTDRADEHATRPLAAQPPAGRPHRHARAAHRHAKAATRPGFAAPGARRRLLAIVSVTGTAVAAMVLFLVLPGSSRAAPQARCPSSARCGATPSAAPSGGAPSLADGAYGSMSAPASHPAASPRITVSRTAQPAATVVTGSPAPSAASGSPGLSPGSLISIEATTACCRTFSITHDSGDDQVRITQVTASSSLAARTEATWIVRPGLADGSCLSFESADTPGAYLRHQDFTLFLDPDNGSTHFAQDATFCPQAGNSGEGYSFESLNDPSMFIRHFDYIVFIASDGGQLPWDATTQWHHDTSWSVIAPWS